MYIYIYIHTPLPEPGVLSLFLVPRELLALASGAPHPSHRTRFRGVMRNWRCLGRQVWGPYASRRRDPTAQTLKLANLNQNFSHSPGANNNIMPNLTTDASLLSEHTRKRKVGAENLELSVDSEHMGVSENRGL